MRANFDKCLKLVIKLEGGLTNHPSDPGGLTNRGVTQAVYDAFLVRAGKSVRPVSLITDDEIVAVYRDGYWDATHCDQLPSGLDLAVFDCAVNQGVGRAARFLQGAAGAKVDEVIGPKTLAAVAAADRDELLTEFMARRMHAYGRLQTLFQTFGLGWSRRLISVHAAAIAMQGDVIQI